MARREEVKVPDIGDFDDVDVVEVLVSEGDRVDVEQSLITLESEKASLEVPSPVAGVVRELKTQVGDKVGEGALIAIIEVGGADETDDEQAAEPEKEQPGERKEKKAGERDEQESAEPEEEEQETSGDEVQAEESSTAEDDEKTETTSASSRSADRSPAPDAPRDDARRAPGSPDRSRTASPDKDSSDQPRPHASPSVRRMARGLGVDLARVTPSGRNGRILASDVRGFVKHALNEPASGGGLPPLPSFDPEKHGPVEYVPLSKINKLTARNVHRSWLHIPHVTHFDESDITELDAFRKEQSEVAEKRGTKLTFLAFVAKAVAATLHAYPRFNSSLMPDGEQLALRRYVNLGVAVDTEAGLVVPVLRGADGKGLFELADELAAVSQRARDGKMTPQDSQGATFTISSLGGLGGTGFTPIVNSPEVAILGVSRAQMKPVFRDGAFTPRLVLPVALSYDHRVIDGAAAARFTRHLCTLLEDLRRVLL